MGTVCEKIKKGGVCKFLFVAFVGTGLFIRALFLYESGVFGHYRAAVVEYAPTWNETDAVGTLMKNSRRYAQIIDRAGKESVDIIVFPEYGLTTINIPRNRSRMGPYLTEIPDVEDGSVPCTEHDQPVAQHLKEISCAAQRNRMYVIVNMYEQSACGSLKAGCPADGILIYNTNIAFDRTGEIIAKYRKVNLFNEPEVNATSPSGTSWFNTDFGVTFGMVIGFDLLFFDPVVQLLPANVTNIVYSSSWISELPFLTSVQIQSGYSYSQKNNLLASGYSDPSRSLGGSGLYSGAQGPMIAGMPSTPTTQLMVANLSVEPNYNQIFDCVVYDEYCGRNGFKIIDFRLDDDVGAVAAGVEAVSFEKDDYHFKREDLTGFVLKPLDESSNDSSVSYRTTKAGLNESLFQYTSGNLVCRIVVFWTRSYPKPVECSNVTYWFVAFSGQREYLNGRIDGLQVCGLIACPGESPSSCGTLPVLYNEDLVNITSVMIDMNSSYVSPSFVSTLDNNMLPLPGDHIQFLETTDELQSEYLSMYVARTDLLTFAIYKSYTP